MGQEHDNQRYYNLRVCWGKTWNVVGCWVGWDSSNDWSVDR